LHSCAKCFAAPGQFNNKKSAGRELKNSQCRIVCRLTVTVQGGRGVVGLLRKLRSTCRKVD